jgi:flagellar hook-associated protein 3 FlgL
MSTTIGGTGAGYGILGTLIANSTAVHQQLDTLTEQVSTGLVSQTYAGLGSGAGISLDLNPQLHALSTAQTNINQATGSMQVTQTAMTQIQQIAATFVSGMPNLNNVNPQEVDSIAANAQQALTQVANLLDTQDGSNYVFGGQDSTQPAGALAQRNSVIGFLHTDQCCGFGAFRQRCSGDHLGDTVNSRLQCHRHVAVLRLHVAADSRH